MSTDTYRKRLGKKPPVGSRYNLCDPSGDRTRDLRDPGRIAQPAELLGVYLQRQEPFDDDSYISYPTICLNQLDKDNTHTTYFSENYIREIDLDIDSGAVVSTYPFVADLIDFNINRNATICTADGTKHVTLGSGTLMIEVTDENLNKHILSIRDVHVAHFVKSLCSVRHLLNYVNNIHFNDMTVVINNIKYHFRWERFGYYWKVRVLGPAYYEDYGDVTSRTTPETQCFCYT